MEGRRGEGRGERGGKIGRAKGTRRGREEVVSRKEIQVLAVLINSMKKGE